GKGHARMRNAHLARWRVRLGLELVSDVRGVLGRVEEVLREIQASGRSGKTVQNHAEALTAFCRWCVSRGYLEEDPLKELMSFNTSPLGRRRAMRADEITKLLENCGRRRRLTCEVAFTSGLRAGELTALTVRHLDTKRGGVELDAAWTKSRKGGFQPL